MKLTPEVLDRITILASYGYTQKTIANMVGISEDHLSKAKKTNSALKNALTVGKTILNADLKANLVKLAMEGTKNDSVKLGATVKAMDLFTDKTETTTTTTTTTKIREDILDELSTK